MTVTSSSARTARRYALYVVAGARGSGKSHLINQLFAVAPPNERWAVLLNEEGRTPIATPPDAETRLTVRSMAGVCACCTGQIVFVTTLGTLIRQTRPDRVFVEASGEAALDPLLHSVCSSFQDAVELERVIVLPSPEELTTYTGPFSEKVVVLDQWPTASDAKALLEPRP